MMSFLPVSLHRLKKCTICQAICPLWWLSALAARQHLKANVVTFSSVMKACRGHWEICLQFMAPRMLKWW